METPVPVRRTTGMTVLTWALYILAGIVLLLSLFLLTSALSFRSAMEGVLTPLILSGILPNFGVMGNALINSISSAVTWLGIVLFLTMIAMSLLLFAAGHLLRNTQRLEARVRALEEALTLRRGESV